MKNSQKGFIIPVLLGIIAALAIGSGVYIYNIKKAEAPVVTNTEVQQSEQSGEQTTNQTPEVNVQPYIEVLSPNGGENWKIGQTYLISTKSNGELGTRTVRLNRYSDDGIRVGQQTIGTTSTDSFSYKVPIGTVETRGDAERYKIQVVVDKYNDGRGISDESDGYFTVTSPSASTSNWKTYTNTQHGFSIQHPEGTQISDTDTSGGRSFYFTTPQGMVMVQVVTQASLTNCNNTASGADRTITRINGVDFLKLDVSKIFSGMNSYTSATEYCAVTDGTAWRIIPRIGYAPGSTPPNVNNNVTLNKMVASFKILIMP